MDKELDWNDLNTILENGIRLSDGKEKIKKIFPLQCLISNNKQCKLFFVKIFIYFTKILYFSLKTLYIVVNDQYYHSLAVNSQQLHILKTITSLYNFEFKNSTDPKNEYIIRPGQYFNLSGTTKNLRRLINEFESDTPNPIIFNEIIENIQGSYPLAGIMGSLYGVTNHPTIFLIIYLGQIYNKDIAQQIGNLPFVLSNFINLFSLPQTFDNVQFVKFLQRIIPNLPLEYSKDTVVLPKVLRPPITTSISMQKNTLISTPSATNLCDESKIDINIHKFLLDLFTESAQGISNRMFSNKSYLRNKVKTLSDDYQFNPDEVELEPICPIYVTSDATVAEWKRINKDIFFIKGSVWYPVPQSSLQRRLFELFGQKVTAGYSGSTFMLINFCVNLLTIELKENIILKKILLLCLISDFVPIYHSLPEILIVFTQELFTNDDIYTIDQNPLEYLFMFLNDGKKNMNSKISINKDQLDSLTFTSNTYYLLKDLLKKNFFSFIDNTSETTSFINQFLNTEISFKIKTDPSSITQETISNYGVFNIVCKI